jgi:hypothetical protein
MQYPQNQRTNRTRPVDNLCIDFELMLIKSISREGYNNQIWGVVSPPSTGLAFNRNIQQDLSNYYVAIDLPLQNQQLQPL